MSLFTLLEGCAQIYRMKYKTIILGSSSGIGLAITEKLLDLGHQVTGISRRNLNLNTPSYNHLSLDITDKNFIYYPSVNYKEFKKYNDKYFKKFKKFPNEITILTYDALGLIYYAWKKNGKINSINDFSFKNKIKGKIGTFSFKNGKVIQELNIYKTDNKKFIKF